MENFDVLHTRLKEAREKAGLTQKALAEKSSVSKQAISNYERDRIPTLESLVAIAETLNVSVDWLLGKEQEKPQSEPENLADVFQTIEMLENALGRKAKIEKNGNSGSSPFSETESIPTYTYDIVFSACPEKLCYAFNSRDAIYSLAKFGVDFQTRESVYESWRIGTLDNLRQYKRENGFQAFQAIDDEDGVLPF